MPYLLFFMLIGCGGSSTVTAEAKAICNCYEKAKKKEEGPIRSKAWKQCDVQKVIKEGKWANRAKKEEFEKAINECEGS